MCRDLLIDFKVLRNNIQLSIVLTLTTDSKSNGCE